MNTQSKNVTPDMGTVHIGESGYVLTVFTGEVKVSKVSRFLKAWLEFTPQGRYYTTGTVELPSGDLVALTDSRVPQSPFGRYRAWR